MKKVTTYEAAEILMKHAINYYNEFGITKRVQFQEIANIEKIDEFSIENGFNHLHFIELIHADTGGGYTLNPKKLSFIIAQSQAGLLKKEINIVNEFNIEGNPTIVQNVGIDSFKQDFFSEVEKDIKGEHLPLWKKIIESGFIDFIIIVAKKVVGLV